MYCRNCNLQYPKGSMFCNNCGSALEDPLVQQRPVEPIYHFEQETEPEQNQPVQVEKKPKSKKKIIAIILSAVGVVALIAGLLWYFLVYNHPINKIKRALNNSIEQLMVNTPTLSNVYHNMKDLMEDREFTLNADVEYSKDESDGDVEKISALVNLNYDAGGEEMGGKADISVYTYDSYDFDTNNKTYNFKFSADDENIYARFDQLGREVYSLPLEDFGKKYQGSALSKMVKDEDKVLNNFLEKADINPYADFTFSTFCKDTDEGKDFIDSLNIEETDEQIPHTDDLTVYRMELSAKEYNNAINAYAMFIVSSLFGEEAAEEIEDTVVSRGGSGKVIICLGINDDDCLVAICMYLKDNEDDYILLTLEGEENIWDEIVLYKGNTKRKLFVEQKNNGFELYRDYDDRSAEKIFECNDSKGELILYNGNTKKYVVEYSDKNDGAAFSLNHKEQESDYEYNWDYDEYVETYSTVILNVDFSIEPVGDIEMIDKDPIAILDLSKSKLEELLDDVEEALR